MRLFGWAASALAMTIATPADAAWRKFETAHFII